MALENAHIYIYIYIYIYTRAPTRFTYRMWRFFPSSWRVCQVCSSLVLVDYKMIDPIPTTLEVCSKSKSTTQSIQIFLATVHYPMIFPIQISSSHLFPVKLANRPRLQRQPGDPAGARLRHRGSQALGRSQVLGWDKVAWLVGNPKWFSGDWCHLWKTPSFFVGFWQEVDPTCDSDNYGIHKPKTMVYG